MKNCLGCKFAKWDKTKAGKLHPSGDGDCGFDFKQPELPASKYYIGHQVICGGQINRREELKTHCVYYHG